ncbi:hypothetical protein T10_10345 [Trichinella papuae]|uniref:Uncharacterized protein n=1 Tax=Trichinella papuae TaxID=268474 RepID=A0A0V1MPU1_9BILA|nr:hypothetical protein T10_10345 [Trichinella papuae]
MIQHRRHHKILHEPYIIDGLEMRSVRCSLMMIDWAGCSCMNHVLVFIATSLGFAFVEALESSWRSSSTKEPEISFRQYVTTIIVSMLVAPVPVDGNHAILFPPMTNSPMESLRLTASAR